MTDFTDPNNSQCLEAAREIVRRHEGAEPEANITSAVRHFLIVAGLAKPEEITEENPPSDSSRRAVDLTALDTFVEMKTRIRGSGGEPHTPYVDQLDDYLTQSAKQGRVRMGILTDGKYWLLRWPGAGEVKTARPYFFTLEGSDRWYTLYEWLRDEALVSLENVVPDRSDIENHFGPNSPSYQRDIDALVAMYRDYLGNKTIEVKRRLWHDLLRTALGEVADTTEEMDDLFVRHTYLTAVIGMVVQAHFGIDIRQLAETDPADLVLGREFRSKTGLQGVVESDFFAWPTEVGGHALLKTVARRVVKFDWRQAPTDIAATLYETVIPTEERRTLGEYYTPAWLARAIVRELIDDPLDKSVLDPACGSGTFVAEAVTHLLEAADKNPNLNPKERLEWLRMSVSGIDVHPVAVHLARAAWVLAARPAIQAAVDHGFGSNITVPIYLGDALQLRTRSTGLFSDNLVTIPVDRAPEEGGGTTFGEGIEALELAFPVSLVKRPEDFDTLMGDVAEAIEQGENPLLALDDHNITNEDELKILENTISVLQKLHSEGRDHIWAYYTRNLVRPVTLGLKKVDVIVGNPPWLNYNKTASILRTELERQSKEQYGIWQGGRYASNQDVAGLFFSRCVDLYLKDGGLIGMVMPHSALQTGQYSKWRTGAWSNRPGLQTLSVDFGIKTAWDLERLEPNTFFPIPASVVFAKRLRKAQKATPLAGSVERWRGKAGAENAQRESVSITDTSVGGGSPYAKYSRQGAAIRPRCLVFVHRTENTASIQAGQTITVNPRRGSNDKEPWRNLDLTAITEQTIESTHVFDVHLGETVVPYATLEPLEAVLPFKRGDFKLPVDSNGVGGIRLALLDRRMRDRWQIVSGLWDQNKRSVNKLSLVERLDYHGELSAQLEWQRNPGERPIRIVNSEAGQPTAAVLHDGGFLVDETLYWITCRNLQEAHYLLAIINSFAMYNAVKPLMAKGQFGPRHLHKHLWKLPIPEFNPVNDLHAAITQAGQAAAEGAAQRLALLRQKHGDELTVAIARRELRKWLRASPEGQAVEKAVGRLLGGG